MNRIFWFIITALISRRLFASGKMRGCVISVFLFFLLFGCIIAAGALMVANAV